MLYISIREREREREGVGGWKKIECVNPVINLNFSYVLNEIVSDSRSGVFLFCCFLSCYYSTSHWQCCFK